MRFLVDMPLSPALARWLQANGHDAVHASAIDLNQARDADIMSQASSEARTIITADLEYPRLLALARATGPSLILFRGGDWGETDIVSRMAELLATLSETDIEGSILVVERDRIRRRRLPIS